MATTIQKWGNSLGLRIPKAIAAQVKFKQGLPIEFDTSNGVLTVRLVRAPRRRRRSKYKVSELLARYKGPYPHRGVFDDPPVGRELI